MQALDLHSASISSRKDHTPGKVFLAKNDPSGYSKPVVQRKLLCMVLVPPAQAHGRCELSCAATLFCCRGHYTTCGVCCQIKTRVFVIGNPGLSNKEVTKTEQRTGSSLSHSGAGDGPVLCMGLAGITKERRTELARDRMGSGGLGTKSGSRGLPLGVGSQIMYFLTVSDRVSASTDREITKLMFSLAENLSSHPRKVSRLSTDLSLTSL